LVQAFVEVSDRQGIGSAMQLPPEDKSPGNLKEARAALASRISRAANDLNPVLMVLAIGLMVLNLTLYLGMAVSREPFPWSPSHTSGGLVAPANAASRSNDGLSGASLGTDPASASR
jgi:hypothetical protein